MRGRARVLVAGGRLGGWAGGEEGLGKEGGGVAHGLYVLPCGLLILRLHAVPGVPCRHGPGVPMVAWVGGGRWAWAGFVELFPDVVYSGPLLKPNSEDQAAAEAKRTPGRTPSAERERKRMA
jgi:hypothetical protein